MSGTEKATPRPWKIAGAIHIFAAGKRGANVCAVGEPRVTTHVGYTPLKIGSKDSDEAYANAALIVRAVNSFDAMLAALKAAPDFGGEPTTAFGRAYREWQKQARAAITKAEEGQ